jgi:hypothetical protein
VAVFVGAWDGFCLLQFRLRKGLRKLFVFAIVFTWQHNISTQEPDMNRQEIAQAKARYQELTNEFAELQFEAGKLDEEMRDKGQYGQVPQRIVDAADHAEYTLKLWKQSNQAELDCIVNKYAGKLGKVIFDEKM